MPQSAIQTEQYAQELRQNHAIDDLFKTLHDGQRVRMDASSGTVTLLS